MIVMIVLAEAVRLPAKGAFAKNAALAATLIAAETATVLRNQAKLIAMLLEQLLVGLHALLTVIVIAFCQVMRVLVA
jgi:hypothetical protein